VVQIVVDRSFTFQWTQFYNERYVERSHDGCQGVFDDHEDAINRYGYTFRNFTHVLPSPLLAPYLVTPAP
jgi:hypothetical protein